MYIELQICYEQIRHYQLKYIQCTYFVFTFQITGSEGQTEDGKGCGDGRRRDHEWTYTNWWHGQPDFIDYICIYIPGYYWMGGSDRGREGVWRWDTSGSWLNYTNWNPGQPDGVGNQHCLGMDSSSSGGAWRDLTCHQIYRYICESV